MTHISMADLASISVAIATLVLAFFTYLGVRQARDAQCAQVCPVLIPANNSQSKEVQNGQATNLAIENVGPGVATDIWIVVFRILNHIRRFQTNFHTMTIFPFDLARGEICRLCKGEP